MRAREFMVEEQKAINDYDKMMTFVNANRLPGVPAEQQVAVYLFKELQKQQELNKNLSDELNAAEQRIDVAVSRGDIQGKELGKHQSELEREREAIGALDTEYKQRTEVSEKQLQTLTDQLRNIKSKPGIDEKAAKALQAQIEKLEKNGLSNDKYQDLERSIANIQNLQRVDADTIYGLVSQVKDARQVSQELEKTKQSMTKDLASSRDQALAKVDQLTKEIIDLKKLAGTVDTQNTVITQVIKPTIDAIKAKVDGLDQDRDETWTELGRVENEITQLSTALGAKQQIMRGVPPRGQQ